MSIQEVPTEELAKFLHCYHHLLAPYFHCKSSSAVEAWTEIEEGERRQLIAAARLAVAELQAEELEDQKPRLYFARPGTAEWGC